jgi:hypothetical protein
VKTGQQIIDYIDRFTEFAIERPELFGLDGVELEGILFAFDDLRGYAIAEGEDGRGRYSDYLCELGYGPRRFMTDRRPLPSHLTDERMQEFRDVANFWRGYLAWRDRN